MGARLGLVFAQWTLAAARTRSMAEYCAAETPEPSAGSSSGQRPRPILWAMPALMLIFPLALLTVSLPPALAHLPDAIFTLVRLTVSFCAALLAYATWRKGAAWSLAFGAIGLLYNPVLTIHMSDAIWWIVHLGALLLFTLHGVVLGSKLSRGA